MGVVHRAFDERLQREVALKALPAGLATDSAERARLEREARAIAQVSHPNVASIFGLEDSDGSLYLVLELVPGETLQERLGRGALAPDEALSVCAQVASGLAAVHRKGLVHRDLKPGNVMVTPEGVAKLLDFGLARRAREVARGEVTRRGEVVGTPGWMSPEQLRGEELDARSDAWAWGVLLFECLAGRPAFPGETITDREAATLRDEPSWADIPAATPAGVVALLRSCLSKDRQGRPASLDDALQSLEDARLTSGERRAGAALPEHSLPAERDAFVGRAAELSELDRLVEEGHRLVSVLGIGGTGKTRLVLRHARASLEQLPGGAWFCDLSEARSVEGIVSAVSKALEVPLGKADPVVQLGHAIAGRGRCLVILDNFEQVARHAAVTLGQWLDRTSEASFVVTTREVLGLPGEQSLALAPLPQAEAESLFVARAKQARSGYEPEESEREVIAELVALLDHLPLAIELAAARVRIMPPEVLLERMSERFKVLASSGARHTRQATLRAALDWSWDLLSEDEQSALAQLSVFEGGFTLEAAEAVLSLESLWPVDAVQALVDKSLVRTVGEARLDLLVSVQEYAAERLVALGGAPEAKRRHGVHHAGFGTQDALDALELRGGEARWRALVPELENLVAASRRAVTRADAEVAAATALAAGAVLGRTGPLHAAIEVLQAARALQDPASQEAARLDVALTWPLGQSGRKDEARALAEAALSRAREAGDLRSQGALLTTLATLHRGRGRMDAARADLEAALGATRELGDRLQEGLARIELGIVQFLTGRMDEARADLEAAVAISRELEHRRLEASALNGLGLLHRDQGRWDEAFAHLDAALASVDELAEPISFGRCIVNRGVNHLLQGRVEAGRRDLEAGLAIQRRTGDRLAEAQTLLCLGRLHRSQGRFDEADRFLEPALAIARELGELGSVGDVLAELGETRRDQGRTDEALAHVEAALAAYREAGWQRQEGSALSQLGELFRGQGRMDEARAALDAADALLEGVADAEGLATLRCNRARLHQDLGDSTSARATLAEAVALAAGIGLGPDSELSQRLAEVRELLEPAE
jgi:predicted ATPase